MSTSKIIELHGFGVGNGIGVGPIVKMGEPLPIPEPSDASSTIPTEEMVTRELHTVTQAISFVAADLQRRADGADELNGKILQATSLMAADPAIIDLVSQKIRRGVGSSRAVYEAFLEFKQLVENLGGYVAERATDLDDVSQRIRARIEGVEPPGIPHVNYSHILVAADLAPADTVGLDYDLIQALVTEGGGPTGHTAILARAHGLPALVGVNGVLDLAEGTVVIADAKTGMLKAALDDEEVKQAKAERVQRFDSLAMVSGPGQLSDGTPIQLLANVGSKADAEAAVEAGAEGVGLFRTEFLFLGTTSAPSLEEQVKQYCEVFDLLAGQKVVVRLLDAGADKPLPYLTDSGEENPALGRRGYRALRDHPEVAKEQLQALKKAAEQSEVDMWVMAPMIADADEAAEFYQFATSCGIKTIGVMAEVPAVALMADQVFLRTDFVSVGTNDLTQYTLAADRLLGSVASYQDPWHPAVLRLVDLLGSAAARAGKPLGVCGEAAADPDLAAVLIGLGANSLSMAPSALPEVRLRLAQINSAQAREAATAALVASTPAEAREKAIEILS